MHRALAADATAFERRTERERVLVADVAGHGGDGRSLPGQQAAGRHLTEMDDRPTWSSWM
jgi:hypothetical protein